MEEQRYTQLQMSTIVLLRVLVGWHYLYEGFHKFYEPGWSAVGYLKAAKGPASGLFHWMANTEQILGVVNIMNQYGLTLIGLGLILGIFTRLSAVSGALIVLLFYLANPPFVGYFSSTPMEGSYLLVNKNLVEMAACLVIATTYSGRYIGLDRILHRLFSKAKAEEPLRSAAAGA
jgi:thiosulfate dehydrogenase (quinone) large subunit